MHLLQYRPLQQQAARHQPGAAGRSWRSICVLAAVRRPHGSLLPVPSRSRWQHQQQIGDLAVVARGAKDELFAELEATQNTLDNVLQAVQAAQAAQQGKIIHQAAAPGAGMVQESALISRDQQLWDRQQALLDRMQQQWDQERQAFLAREQQLVSELAQLRQELHHILLNQAAAAAAVPTAAAAARPSISSVASLPAAAAAASSAASRPGASAQPGQAVISGPSNASAAVAAAIRAVRDEGLTDKSSLSGDEEGDGSSWQDLFSSSGQRAVGNVASALAAVESGADVLADLDLTFNSSSRGRRRLDGSNGSNGSNGGSSSSSSSSLSELSDDGGNSSSSSVDGGSSVVSTATGPLAESTEASGSSSNGRSSSSSSSGSSGVVPVEVQKGDPQGPPPLLAAGDDDIFWVSKLHDGLMTAGYYPSDDEVENWLFGEGTQTALLTFQACNGLPETGVTCEATWRQLLGEEQYQAAYADLSSSSSSNSSSNGDSGSSGSNGVGSSSVVESTESANGEVLYSFGSSSSTASDSSSSSSSSDVAAYDGSSGDSSSGGRVSGTGWPVVMDMDGGRDVHMLQVCLQKAGFFCGDDDMRWWQFGSSTLDALKTFQACSGLPESGVADERTWLALLGPEATPADLDAIRGDESMYEDDMSAPHEGAVWLVGEQRWSMPPSSSSN